MIEAQRKSIEDIIDYTGVEVDEAQLEQQLEAALAEQLDDLDALDAEHIAGILAAAKAAETATDWARINDENIGKITNYLIQDDRVLAHKKEQETKIAVLERKVKNAYFIAGGAAVVAFVSLVLCLITLI